MIWPLGLTVRTPPFHGGNVGFKSRRGHYIALWSNGRASDSDSENQGSIPWRAAVVVADWQCTGLWHQHMRVRIPPVTFYSGSITDRTPGYGPGDTGSIPVQSI